MKVLVTGSSGHLGEALIRTLNGAGHDVTGLDIVPGAMTTDIGSITDPSCVARAMAGAEVVFHAATLHKPHAATHSAQAFIDTNVSGTLTLLEEATRISLRAFIFTSTTSVFGDALIPPVDAPAAWITEEVRPIPKNIYGVTKAAAEDLCQLFYRNKGLSCIVLWTSRFFPEQDDDETVRAAYADDNMKANEYLHRRVELDDCVQAHLLAAEQASRIGFARYIVSAATPFTPDDLTTIRADAPRAVEQHVPGYVAEYARRNWKMLPRIDRVYVSDKARRELGWQPRYDFGSIVDRLSRGESMTSPLTETVGSKGYHAEAFSDGPYPVAPHLAVPAKGRRIVDR